MEWADLSATLFSERNFELLVRCSVQVILLTMSAFFSGSEVALFSLSHLDLSRLESQRHKAFPSISRMLAEPRELIISILCGNESVNIASSANMAAMLLLFFTGEETQWINLVVMVPMLLLVGEVTPKTFAITSPQMFATRVTAPLLPKWIIIVRPVRAVVRVVADAVTTFVAGHPKPKEVVLHTDEFRTLVEEGEANGALDAREKVLIDNMLEASETEVIQIMTPCTRMHYVDADKPMSQVVEEFRRFRHPHLPVVRKHRNHVIGFLEAEDMLRLLKHNTDFTKVKIDELLRPAHFVPPNKKVDEMFDYFNHNKTWAAIVLGEYGDVFGIVTIADVLGFVFGGISQKIGAIGYTVRKGDPDQYVVSGDMNIALLDEMSGLGLDLPEDNNLMATTVGGYVFHLLGRLPGRGDVVEEDGVRFRVTEMDHLRVKCVEIERFADAHAGEEERPSRSQERQADQEPREAIALDDPSTVAATESVVSNGV